MAPKRTSTRSRPSAAKTAPGNGGTAAPPTDTTSTLEAVDAKPPPQDAATSAVRSHPRTTVLPKFVSCKVPPQGSKAIACVRSHPPSTSPLSLIFTHGAGGGLDAPAMTNFSHGFAATGAAVTAFQGNTNLKGRAALFATVLAHERTQDAALDASTVAFGGRSMGARAAVLASNADPSIQRLVLVSYPLVGPRGDVRDQILLDVRADVDVLFISGDGDSMCHLDQLDAVRTKMRARTWLVTVAGADHGMNVHGGTKLKQGTEELGKQAGRIAAEWLQARTRSTTSMTLRWDGSRAQVVGTWGDDSVPVDKATGDVDRGGMQRYFTKADDQDTSAGAASGVKRKRASQ